VIDLLRLQFMQNAILACLLGGACLSILGVCLTLMELPFLGISMSHAAFLGAVAGLLFGFEPLAGAVVACALSGLLVGPAADRAGASANAILGILFSATMGLAFLFLARIPGPKAEALNLIWGSILTISRGEILMLSVVFLLVAVLLLVFFKEIAAVLFNREIAAASGIPEKAFYYGIVFVSGLIVSASLDIVGGLLIFSLLVNPASAARQITYRLPAMFVLASLFGIAACFSGLVLSYLFAIPTGAVIVLSSTACFLLAFLLSPKRRGPDQPQEMP
jgi:manganese/iron transport system permease protein